MKKTASIFLFLLISFSASAETIKAIRIVNQLGESYASSSVAAFTSFKVGEQVSDRETILSGIASDVNRMRASGRFSYVNARMDVEPDGLVLVYTVEVKHRLRRIEIVGAQKMRNRKVRKKSGLELGQLADDSTFAQAAIKIKEAYRDFWYPEAKVSWDTSVNDELGTVDVVFHIEEGPKVAIKKILFNGNGSIKEKTLRKAMKQKQKKWYSFITGSGKFKPEDIDMDIFAIKSIYMNEGFLDVRVSDPKIDMSDPKKARMVFDIVEGQRYRVGKISLRGVKSFSKDEVRHGIQLATGDIAAYRDAEAGTESIRAFYGNRGYINTRVHPVFDPDSQKGTVDIRYDIVEGNIGYIDMIKIRGNARTKDKVIRRELVIYPGDKYNRGRVKTSENRLRNLNYFEFVSSSPVPTDKSGQYDLDIQVKEKPTGQFSAGVGFSSVDSLVGYVELSQGNFDFKSWPPVGAGQKFKVRLQVGSERNDVDISFVEPWFLNRKLSLGIDLFHHESRYFSDDYDQKNNGMRISLGKPLSPFSRGMLAYSLEQFDVYDVSDTASDAIKREEGKRTKSGLDLIWTRDTRNRFFIPTRGNRTIVNPYFAGGPLGAETDIYGAKIRSGQYWPLPWKTVLNLRGQIESVDHYGDSDFVPIFDRLFLGGPNTLRGYEYRDVGPKDDTGEPVGGRSSLYATVEYTWPIWKRVRGAAFYDWGVVNLDFVDFDPSDFNDDVGIGIRLDLPGFPLHLDYAWPITYDEKWQDGKGRFNFQIGHSF